MYTAPVSVAYFGDAIEHTNKYGKHVKGKVQRIGYDTFLEWLKYAETWHARSGLEVGIGSSFEFLTAEQLAESLCSEE